MRISRKKLLQNFKILHCCFTWRVAVIQEEALRCLQTETLAASSLDRGRVQLEWACLQGACRANLTQCKLRRRKLDSHAGKLIINHRDTESSVKRFPGMRLALLAVLASLSLATAFVGPACFYSSPFAPRTQHSSLATAWSAGRRGLGAQTLSMQVEKGAAQGARLVKFKAADMEIVRPLGEMGFALVTDWEYYGDGVRNPLNPETPSRTIETQGASIRLFEARIARGSLMNARVLLKEYFPGARDLAAQELRVYTDLVDDWAFRAPNEDFVEAPVATLRGWFETSFECRQPSFVNNWKEKFPRVEPPEPGNLWLVFRWDGGRPLPELWRDRKKAPSFWDGLSAPAFGSGNKMAKEERYLRQVIKNSIASLAFLHDRSVLHRSIGSPSITVSSLDADDSASVRVRLRDFGFASRAAMLDDDTVRTLRKSGAVTPTEMFSQLVAEDVYALGLALLEMVFSTLTRAAPQDDGRSKGPAGLMKAWMKQTAGDKQTIPGTQSSGAGLQTDQGSLKKLVEDVFDFDVTGAFRDYCAAETEWEDVVAFLDDRDGAGWKLFDSMLNEPRRSKRRGGAGKEESSQSYKELSEMSQEDLAGLVPSFVPKQVRITPAVTARSLLGSDMFSDLGVPWWLPREKGFGLNEDDE